jgi:uncharacterized membrane protein YgdD (TMEM256/DUF423 family)
MIVRLAAILGFLGVVSGALGAHPLKPHLIQLQTLSQWQTAVFFHLIHSIALLCLGSTSKTYTPLASIAFFIGVLTFSGSLYFMALTGNPSIGTITPIGGILLLIGWGSLLFAPHK